MQIALTGNHHLFLILKTKSNEDWIVLLGKRRRHFPFFNTRFENATFLNATKDKLYHQATEEMPSLRFDCRDRWTITGKEPFDFRLVFVPTFLKKRWVFLNTSFQYHLLDLYFKEGSLRGEPLDLGHGISEWGRMPSFSAQDWQVPFEYELFLEAKGKGGSLRWNASLSKPEKFMQRIPHFIKKTFLHDRFQWGDIPNDSGHLSPSTLAQTTIPLKDWTLKREIVRISTSQNQIWYGLKEFFER